MVVDGNNRPYVDVFGAPWCLWGGWWEILNACSTDLWLSRKRIQKGYGTIAGVRLPKNSHVKNESTHSPIEPLTVGEDGGLTVPPVYLLSKRAKTHL